MNRLRVIAVIPLYIFALDCATTPRAPSFDNRPAIPINASSMPSGYGVQLRLDGSAVVRDDWLYVKVPAGSVRTYQGTTDAWDLMIRAGLATCTGKGKWRIVSESRAARIAPLVGLTRDSSTLDTNVRVLSDTLHLDLGVPRGTDMRRAWVTFEIAWPFQNVLAEYTLPTGVVLASPSERQKAAGAADKVCR